MGQQQSSAWLTTLGPAPAGALALDLACGSGRNSLALVGLGYRVVATDIAASALTETRRRITTARPSWDHSAQQILFTVQADCDAWTWSNAAFDLIVQSDFLCRPCLPQIRAGVRPGGLLVIDTFLYRGRSNRGGPSNPEYMLRPGELAELFADWEVLDSRETDAETCRGSILARRPFP